MHSKLQFLLHLFVGNLILFHGNFISGASGSFDEDPSDFLKSIKPIEDRARFKFPSTLGVEVPKFYIKSIRTAIEATAKYDKCYKPLTFFTGLDEICLVNQTAKTLDGKVVNSLTVATITGGILGNDVYELHKGQFYWQNKLCNETHNLEGRAYYYNLKYGSYEKAIHYPDGMVVVNFPVATHGDLPNPKFESFSKLLRTKIKQKGDYTKVNCGFTFSWFLIFPYGSIYHAYRKEFYDEGAEKTYNALIIDLPLDQRISYISNKQFENSFGKIEGISDSDESSTNGFLGGTPEIWSERHKGICVVNLPA